MNVKNIQKERCSMSRYPKNYIYYPFNYFEPYKIKVENKNYTMHKVRFNTLYELYEVLKSNPKTNSKFDELSSLTGSSDFAGKPYEEAVEDLIQESNYNYNEFLRLQKGLTSAQKRKVHEFKTVKTVGGGQIHIPSYSAGMPLCYETEERISKPRFIRIHSNICYNCITTKKQVLHKAIITVNLIKALENAHYNVDLNLFELSQEYNELAYFIIQAKKHGRRIGMDTLYKTSCNVEFLRRILFRILETTDVRNDWADGYGTTCSDDFTKKVLNISKNDILLPQPSDMGIGGKKLAKDFVNAIEYLGLEDKFDVERVKNEFTKEARVLKI